MKNRIRPKDIMTVRAKRLHEQGYTCALCKCAISPSSASGCLDHNHITGAIRAVLCRNCNGIEGKIYNLANRAKRNGTVYGFLLALMAYYDMWKVETGSTLYHPNHKTGDEKRIARNNKVRVQRATAKAKANIKGK